MKAMNKYLTEAKVKLTRQVVKKILSRPKSSMYEIEDKKVSVTVVGDTMIWNYPSDFHELTYILIDLSDDMEYKYQQIGMNTKSTMKFIVDLG